MTDSSRYYIEATAIGNSIKVTAIDPATGIEASIVGVATLPREQLAQLAVRKLKYVLDKREGS